MSATTTDVNGLIDDLLPAFQPDPQWLVKAESFYADTFHGRAPADFLCHLPGKGIPGHETGRFNLKEQWHDPERMFYEHLRAMVSVARTGKGAALPRLRANLGVGFVPSVVGIEQIIFDDKMPWPQGHLSKEQITALEPADFEDVSERGLIPYATRIYDVYRKHLGTHRFTYLPDMQGVLDVAHLIRGDSIFMDPYDDAPFMHHLMECALQIWIAVTKHLKAHIGEPLDGGNHMGMKLANGGVRYCMDTSVLCRRDMLEAFELPYLRRALQAFAGGWVHFCGTANHLVTMLREVPEVRGINPNYMENQPYDYLAECRTIREHGKFFLGAPFRTAEQTLDDYLDFCLEPLVEPGGLILQPRGEGMGEETADSLERAWQAAIERRWG